MTKKTNDVKQPVEDQEKLPLEIKDEELKHYFYDIQLDLQKIEDYINSQNGLISEDDYQQQLDKLNDIKNKFNEFLDACKKCEEFIEHTDKGKINSVEVEREKNDAEGNFDSKWSYLNEVLEYIHKVNDDYYKSKIKKAYNLQKTHLKK